MKWNEVVAIWGGQKLPPLPPPDLILETFEADRQQRERLRFRRDLLEAITGIVVFCILAFVGMRIRKAFWLFEVAAAMTLVPVTVYIFERLRSRRQRVSAEAPLLVRLDAEIAELCHQRWLWLNVGYWYIAPPALGITLGWTTLVLNNRALWEDPAARTWVIILYLSGISALGWAWIRLRTEGPRNADQRLAQLEPLRGELASTGQP